MKPTKEKKTHRGAHSQVSDTVVDSFVSLSTLPQHCSCQLFVTKMVTEGETFPETGNPEVKFQMHQLPLIHPLVTTCSPVQSGWMSLTLSIENGPWSVLTSRLEPKICSSWISGNTHLSWIEMVVLYSWQILQENASVDTSQSGRLQPGTQSYCFILLGSARMHTALFHCNLLTNQQKRISLKIRSSGFGNNLEKQRPALPVIH